MIRGINFLKGRIVEQSHLPAKQTLEQLGIARRTFCRWYDRFLTGDPEALKDRPSAPRRVWNRTPDTIHDRIIELALEQSELSPPGTAGDNHGTTDHPLFL